ncbi:Na+/H+ antiporter subunit E [Aeromicrobium duanguangcaii]|uniref:Na+/H+ antiporter subunit E n=1 Tax=Aeromicrobium duanguangcaii TaxID=2968086 RepID=A0ABY5KEE3_9ACTN|nr:Na+/H+ antiporter subunit E [Aeromicrobium duanguangcaii]MCD9154095.1 Na+/H+ antiporter subunit E [Aeromicrobium duanguangcaii]MCL3837831.1 Na+/H+ antiporter subunit E [Aeromicrobium duanguangcaii]UUI68832.1 Na+/H+ antiporter subunit E [Aeromicrobium duanguangcaii]
MADRVRGLRVWHVPVIGWLTIVWLLLWGEVTPINLAGGVLVSAITVMVFPFPRVSVDGELRPWATLVLLSRFIADLALASFNVAWLAIRPATPPPSAVLQIDLVSGSELRQTLTGELISLVPGSLLIELDSEGRRMWLHVLDAGTPERVRAARDKARMQEHRLLKAIGTDAEVRESERRLREDAS